MIRQIERLIEQSIAAKPLQAIWDYCKPYYSSYYQFAYLLAKEIGEHCVAVELGVEKARWSFSVLQANVDVVIGIDTNPTAEALKLAEANKKFVYLNQPSSQVPIEALAGRYISILHIDTEHSYSMARMEFETYLPYLARPSFVLFDDTNAMDQDVLRYVYTLPYKKIINNELHPVCGYAVVIVE